MLFDFSATRLALWNTFILGLATATLCTAIALVVAYLVTRQSVAGASLLGYLATAPIAIPGIVLGVGPSWPIRARPFRSMARSGSCSSPS